MTSEPVLTQDDIDKLLGDSGQAEDSPVEAPSPAAPAPAPAAPASAPAQQTSAPAPIPPAANANGRRQPGAAKPVAAAKKQAVSPPVVKKEAVDALEKRVRQLEDSSARVAELEGKLDQADQQVVRLAELEGKLAQANQQVARLTAHLETLSTMVQGNGSAIDRNAKSLDSTVLYGARKVHVCKSCGTKGYIAAHIQCTQCGTEDWWGYWPREGRPAPG